VSYREEGNFVVLTMSRMDWANLMMTLGIAAGSLGSESPMLTRVFNLVNRLNEGNPHNTPYKLSPSPGATEEKK